MLRWFCLGALLPAVAGARPVGPSPDSPSVILRAGVVLLVQVARSEGPTLELEVEQVLKGKLPPKDDRAIFDATSSDGGQAPAPALWLEAHPTAGARFIAFASAGADSAASALGPALERLVPAAHGLADVKVALQAEQQDGPLGATLRLARPQAASLELLFVEYLDARYGPTLATSEDRLGALLSFVEEAPLPPATRMGLIALAVARLGEVNPAPRALVLRMTRCLLRLLDQPQAAALHTNIIDTFLPTTVGLNGHTARWRASELLGEEPLQAKRAVRTLQAYKGEASTEALIAWLKD